MGRSKKDYVKIALKGLAMGGADIIPGVSGGTIALIAGIYEEFVNALKSFSGVIQVLVKEGIVAAWKHVNGNFLLALFSGIVVSFLSLVQFVKYALNHHPILLWSFFFGLIIASSYYVSRQVKRWNILNVIALMVGAVLIFMVTSLSPSETSDAHWFVFVSGMLAICAMILPGISGAFILVLLGKYNYIIESISELRLDVIVVFALGCVAGLLSFSHLLSLMLRKYHDLTIAVLTGLMLGSLNKIWPWKNTLEWGLDRHGEKIALIQNNVLPQDYVDGNNQVGLAVTLFVLSIILLVGLERLSKNKETN